jgi:hypothetical protein
MDDARYEWPRSPNTTSAARLVRQGKRSEGVGDDRPDPRNLAGPFFVGDSST